MAPEGAYIHKQMLVITIYTINRIELISNIIVQSQSVACFDTKYAHFKLLCVRRIFLKLTINLPEWKGIIRPTELIIWTQSQLQHILNAQMNILLIVPTEE